VEARMKKHEKLVERLQNPAGPDHYKISELCKEAADLLEAYGDALERLGNMTRFIEEPQRYMHEWYKEDYLEEIRMRNQYARDSIEEGIE
jgi:hypothetical protein